MARSDEASIRKIVESVLRTRFGDVEIVSVDVRPDVDASGDRILLITIVFDAKEKGLDARETSSLARRILPKMQAVGEEGFPVFSFIAKSELGKLKPETA